MDDAHQQASLKAKIEFEKILEKYPNEMVSKNYQNVKTKLHDTKEKFKKYNETNKVKTK